MSERRLRLLFVGIAALGLMVSEVARDHWATVLGVGVLYLLFMQEWWMRRTRLGEGGIVRRDPMISPEDPSSEVVVPLDKLKDNT